MKILFLVLCFLMASALAAADDLRILRPRIFNTGKTEEVEVVKMSQPETTVTETRNPDGTTTTTTTSKNWKKRETVKMTLYKVRFMFILYNGSGKTFRVPTKGLNYTGIRRNDGTDSSRRIGSQLLPQDTFGLTLHLPAMGKVSDEDGIAPFPVIVPDSELGMVELKPGQGTFVALDHNLKTPLKDGDKFRICYQLNDPATLYNTWNGEIYSPPFRYKAPKQAK